MKKKPLAVCLVSILLFVFLGCKKENVPTVSEEERHGILDSVNMLFKDVYLWNDKIDRSIIPGGYGDNEFNALTLRRFIDDVALSAIDPTTALPYEFDIENAGMAKYSTFVELNTSMGTIVDFGFAITTVPSHNEYRILYVKKRSSAALQGLIRSDRVMKVNGKDVETISLGNTAFIKSALQDDHIVINLKRGNNEEYAVTLLKEKKSASEILKDSVLEVNDSRIGYLALRSFPALSKIKDELDDIFIKFERNDINDLIVDLRYNPGGYVSTSRYLSNLIAPKDLEGKKMYHLEYNNLMQKSEQQYLKNFKVYDFLGLPEYKPDGTFFTYADYDYSRESNTFYFEKKGALNGIKTVTFIVSKQTASAAELLINNLKPYLPVKLIGHDTYGKPVGYFAIETGNYAIYLSSFLALNALDEGRYYNGLPVDVRVEDNVFFDFGSLSDPAIKMAISSQISNKTQKTMKLPEKAIRSQPFFVEQTDLMQPPNQTFRGLILDDMPAKK